MTSREAGRQAVRRARGWLSAARRWLPELILALVLVTQGALAAWFARRSWFGVDAMHYFASRGPVGGGETLWEPYAGHFQPALILMYRGLFGLFGMRTFWPYVALAIAVHVLLCLVIFAVLVRLGIDRWVAVATVSLLAYFGTGSEAYLSDAPMALSWPLLLGYAAILVSERFKGRRLGVWIPALLLLLAVGISAAAVVVLVLVTGYMVACRGWRAAGAMVLPATALFSIWFAIWGRDGGRADVSGWELTGVPTLVWEATVRPLGSLVGVESVGLVLTLLVVAAVVLVTDVPPAARALGLAGLLAAVVQATLTALANLDAGASATAVGRYQYVILALLLPGVAVGQQALVKAARMKSPRRGVVPGTGVLVATGCAFLLVAVVVHGIGEERRVSAFNRAQAEAYQALLFGTAASRDLGQRMLSSDTERLLADGRDIGRLAAPEVRGELPAFEPDAKQRLTAESEYFVGVGDETYRLAGPAEIGSFAFDSRLSQKPGCRSYRADGPGSNLFLQSFEGAQIAVTSQSDRIFTRLERDGRSGVPKGWNVEPGETVYIGTSAQLAVLEVSFSSAGMFEICHV